jgi:hypothetical protein
MQAGGTRSGNAGKIVGPTGPRAVRVEDVLVVREARDTVVREVEGVVVRE